MLTGTLTRFLLAKLAEHLKPYSSQHGELATKAGDHKVKFLRL